MKNVFVLISIAMFASCAMNANRNSIENSPKFITEHGNAFIQQTNLASYLVWYDKMAWITSDTLSKYEADKLNGEIGNEWFGYSIGSDPVFVYGKYEDEIYKPSVRYTINKKNQIIKTQKSNDSLEYKYAKAIHLIMDDAYLEMSEQGCKFNWYVYTDSSTSNINVLFLPSMGQEGAIIYGHEFEYTLNNAADSIIEKRSSLGNLRYFIPQKHKKIVIKDLNEDVPELGNLYTVQRWGDYIDDISIRTGKNFHRFLKTESGGGAWVTIVP